MHTVSSRLTKAPFIKQLQDSTMFAVKLCEITKDRQTGENIYTNYEAVLFAKTAAAIQFYTDATAEGGFIVVSAEKLQVKVSDCGKYTSLSMENARLENAHYAQPQPQYAQPQPQYAPQPQPQPQYAPQPQQQQQQQQGEQVRSWGDRPQQ